MKKIPSFAWLCELIFNLKLCFRIVDFIDIHEMSINCRDMVVLKRTQPRKIVKYFALPGLCVSTKGKSRAAIAAKKFDVAWFEIEFWENVWSL